MIRKAILLFALALSATMISCKEEDRPAVSGSAPIMTFEEQSYDFGAIDEGDIVQHVFIFKNTGGSELVISNAVGSCGCTIPEFPRDPIAPGTSGEMKVKFNSTGKSGHQTKTVNITTNTEKKRETLTIKASVTPNPARNSGISSH